MPSSVLTYFLNNPIQSGSSAGLLDLTQPAASTSTTGWTVGTIAATNWSRLTYNVEVPTTNFTTTQQPSGAPISAGGKLAQDCWRTSVATTGDFSAGTWYSALSVIAVTSGGDQGGRMQTRLWRSVNADGTAATEITKTALVAGMLGTSITLLSTTVAKSSSASTQVAAFSLNNEFIFMQVAWDIQVAGGATTRDVLIRMGPITDLTNGSFLVTAPFTPTGGGGGAAASGAGFYTHRKHWSAA